LNGALRQILADGTYTEIRTQYFDYDIYGDEVSMTHLGGVVPVARSRAAPATRETRFKAQRPFEV
jgi:hypothetical protein